MRNMTIEQIGKACGGRLFIHGRETDWEEALAAPGGREELAGREAAGAVLDSRQVEPGFLFIAVKGERTDGHSYVQQVLEKGALAAVCERVPAGVQGPCIVVRDSLLALRQIAAFYRKQMAGVKLVGITGSVGKTSTKEFLAAVLSRRFCVLKTEKNYNNEIGVPLTILKLREEHQAAVVEMGINHFGEMHRLSEVAQPDVCLLTNIGQCHLEFLGSRDGILRAKSEIFDCMKEDGLACVNGDDDKLITIEKVKGRPPVRFGLSPENDFYATDVVSRGLLGSDAQIHCKGKPDRAFPVHIPLPGGHMVYNALAAAAVGTLFGLTQEEISGGIKAVQPAEGRGRILQAGGFTLIDDCYNANPVSMRAALDLLAEADGRKTALLGDMFELGRKEDFLHAQVGAYAVEKGIDCLVCVGKRSVHMYEAAKEAAEEAAVQGEWGIDLYYFDDLEKLLPRLQEILLPGDNVLIKASHGMQFARLTDRLTSQALN